MVFNEFITGGSRFLYSMEISYVVLLPVNLYYDPVRLVFGPLVIIVDISVTSRLHRLLSFREPGWVPGSEQRWL